MGSSLMSDAAYSQTNPSVRYWTLVEPLREDGRKDGRGSPLYVHVLRSEYDVRFDRQREDGLRILDVIAEEAVRKVSYGIKCCVRHLLIGHYDGSECVGLAPTASGPESSSASGPAPADPAS
jgi:hypothetical protein